ncbi:MAG: adenylate/guanylate cyclase domain-containing protein, partial [Burkholderiales bacterium]|nr:adenylate/guanylate cyclase domain-containing protein [Opitutaceae bacterium]
MSSPSPTTSTAPFLTRLPWWRQIRVRVTGTLSGLVLFVAGALFVTNWQIRRVAVLESFQNLVVSVGGMGAVALDGDAIALIEIEPDALTPQFAEEKRKLEALRVFNNLTPDEIYVLRPAPGGGVDEAEFVVMTDAEPFVGNRYMIREENREAYHVALREGVVTHTDIYTDEHGTWISGYAPIRNAAGAVVALLEVDAEISRFEEALADELMVEALVTLAALLAAIGPAFYLGNRLTQGARALAQGMRRFESGQMDARVELTSRDEIAAMAAGFNRMAQSVGDRLRLLPFVSRFTAQAVEKSRTVENWLEGVEREVVVLMTDVRGFTAASREMQPAELINALNGLLATQTEIIAEHGGDVDKFMGDAVLAVWPAVDDAVERAAKCALALQAKMNETRPAWVKRDPTRPVLG